MRSIEDLSKEKLDKLEWIMFHACPSNDPWADMMNLHGAGDEADDSFPFDLDAIEKIEITRVGGNGSEEAGSDVGSGAEPSGAKASGAEVSGAESQSTSSQKKKKKKGGGLGLGVGIDVNLS
jgi:hypothetical protein